MSEIRTDYSSIHFQDNGKLKLLIIVGTRPGNHPAGGGDQQMPEIF